jgi:hypothetical protein
MLITQRSSASPKVPVVSAWFVIGYELPKRRPGPNEVCPKGTLDVRGVTDPKLSTIRKLART